MSRICALEVDDGLTFGAEAMTTRAIREGDTYEGIRVRVPVALATARLSFRVDLNFGDPIVPGAVVLPFPSFLDETFQLVGYPLATVLAEKLVTMVQLGNANSRDRDFGDVLRIARMHPIDGRDLAAACHATAEYRGVAVRALSHLSREFAARRQGPWSRWLHRAGLAHILPEDFTTALADVRQFADPVLSGMVSTGLWDPRMWAWTAS